MRTTLVAVALPVSFATIGTALAASPAKIDVSLLGEGGSDMEINLSQDTIKSGKVEFNVVNNAMTESHEIVLVRLNSADQNIPIIKDKHRIDEGKLKAIAEVSDLKAGAHRMLFATLSPGTYELLCNVKGHYEAGMHTLLRVMKQGALIDSLCSLLCKTNAVCPYELTKWYEGRVSGRSWQRYPLTSCTQSG
jgi:uncharacterized cupredoxin-like copper-binding protein